MTSQPDKLFRNKLENFQKPVPAAAWNRIEAGLEKSNNKGLWMKIAAGLILLTIAGILLWPSNDTANANLLTNTTSTPPQRETKTKNSITERSTPSLSPMKGSEAKGKNNSIKKTKEAKKEQIVLLVAEQDQKPRIQNPVTSTRNPESTTTPEVIIAQTKVEVESTSKTIVYTVSEVNSKFLKKESPVEATTEERKSSGIQKLMGLAYNLKNSESGLGDLRQKKDEILALNFRDKKQGQN